MRISSRCWDGRRRGVGLTAVECLMHIRIASAADDGRKHMAASRDGCGSARDDLLGDRLRRSAIKWQTRTHASGPTRRVTHQYQEAAKATIEILGEPAARELLMLLDSYDAVRADAF